MPPPYLQAVQFIQDWIKEKKLPAGARLPSARNMAAELGFGYAVINRAYQALIFRGSLIRRGYKLFVGTAHVSPPPIEGIVYVISYWSGFLKGATRILTERGVTHRTVELSYKKYANPLPVLRRIFAEKPAGLILWMPYWLEGLIPVLESAKIPMTVCADVAPREVNLNVVGTDLYRGTEKALRHLLDLGHHRIAHVSIDDSSPLLREIADCYREACLRLNLKSSASMIWQAESDDPEVIHQTMLEQRKKNPKVTALFARGPIATMAMRFFRVPEEISVIGILGQTLKSNPLLTTIDIRDGGHNQILWACTNIISQIQNIESGLPPIPPSHVLFVPDLMVQKSTRAVALVHKEPAASAQGVEGARTPDSHAYASPEAPRSRSASPWESWRRSYPFLEKRCSHIWHQLDLNKLANHSMTRENGWLGEEPLLHFLPGLRSIHGVPFYVIDETRNGGCSVVTFRSPQTHSAKGKKLPSRASLRMDGRLKAFYFLHGCGFAKPLPFARYIVHYKNGKTSSVPLIPLGPTRRFARKGHARPNPNLQDWWPGNEQRDFPHARHITIFDPANPEAYMRYLYTLEWINPCPREEVSSIEVRVDPKAGPTLALIAVTALL